MAKSKYARPPYVCNSDRDPYERQFEEPDLSWQGFVIYRDMGIIRSLDAAAKRFFEIYPDMQTKSMNPENLHIQYRWFSPRWGWRARVEAWDRVVDEEHRKKAINEVRKMTKRHISVAKEGLELCKTEMHKWLKLSKASDANTVLEFKEIMNGLQTIVKLEREARGQPGEITKEVIEKTETIKVENINKLLADPEALDALDLLNDKLDEQPN